MIRQTTSQQPASPNSDQRFRLLQVMGWLGSMGLLSQGIAGAQAAPDAVVVPTIPEPVPALEAAPVELAPAAVEPAPVFEAPIPAPEVIIPQAATPAPIPEPTLVLPAPPVSSPKAAIAGKDAYIDPTDYSLGATSGYEAPSSVVLSERSTGCQAVLQGGQGVAGSLCPPPAAPAAAPAWRPQPRTEWVSQASSAPAAASTTMQIGPLKLQVGPGSTTAAGRTYFRNYTNRPAQASIALGNSQINLIFPLPIPVQITSMFGWRVHPISGDRRFHSGTDLGAPMGTPVLAAYSGTVSIADFLGGYGLTVVLEHNKATQETLYAHLSEIFVRPGDVVEQGTVIGRVGSTGNSTGPHLHFEFRELTPNGWVALDPGDQLEHSLAQLIQYLQTAQAPATTQTAAKPQG